MNIFQKFNRNKVDDRQIDTLIGLAKGVLADGIVNQDEAEVLLTWLIQSRQSTENPIIINLLDRVSSMLEDEVLDESESKELFTILLKITGEKSEIGELGKTTSLPIDSPFPSVSFNGNKFLFTGQCAFGSRTDCEKVIQDLGGVCAKSVTKDLDYLVIGTYVTDSWAHENYGRKIEKAMEYRDKKGVPLSIITEEHWLDESNLS